MMAPSSHFWEYIVASVVSDDSSNADTEAPNGQDEFINSIDPQLAMYSMSAT